MLAEIEAEIEGERLAEILLLIDALGLWLALIDELIEALSLFEILAEIEGLSDAEGD